MIQMMRDVVEIQGGFKPSVQRVYELVVGVKQPTETGPPRTGHRHD
jgi:hypothetical protein